MSTAVHLRRAAPDRAGRGALAAFLEIRGLVGAHRAPHGTVRVSAADGTSLAGSYLPGPTPDAPAVLLLHGFAARRSKPAYAYLADELSREHHVLTLDLRGHGGSRGTCTLGDRECLDVSAGIEWLRGWGHPWVAVVGLSMGGTSVLHGAAAGAAPDAVVTVSTPARFRDDPPPGPLRRLDRVWRSRALRLMLRVALGVTVVAPERWDGLADPVVLAAGSRVPLLAVHGRDDAYFPPSDAEDLATRAAGPATSWIEPVGFGHAEDGVTAAFAARLSAALLHARATGAFPARQVAA